MQTTAPRGPAGPLARPPALPRHMPARARGAAPDTSRPGPACMLGHDASFRRAPRRAARSITASAGSDTSPKPAPPPPMTQAFMAIADAGSRGARDALELSDYEEESDVEPSTR